MELTQWNARLLQAKRNRSAIPATRPCSSRSGGVGRSAAGQVSIGGYVQTLIDEAEDAVGRDIKMPVALSVKIKRERHGLRRADAVVSQAELRHGSACIESE